MEINKDLIIENTNTSLNTVADYINNPYDILYTNSTAQLGTINLSKSVLNYKFIIVEWKPLQYYNYWATQQTIIVSPTNNTTYNFSNACYNHDGNKQIYVTWTNYTIKTNGTQIEVPTSNSNQAGTVGAATSYTGAAGCWGITRVFGWK